MRYVSSSKLASLSSPSDDKLVVWAEADQVTRDHILECLELLLLRSSRDHLDAGGSGFQITCPEIELQLAARIGELGAHLVAEVADQLFDIALRS